MVLDQYDEDSDREEVRQKNFTEFDCPLCNANNPYGDGFSVGAEVRCYYCGAEFKVLVTEAGKLRLKER